MGHLRQFIVLNVGIPLGYSRVGNEVSEHAQEALLLDKWFREAGYLVVNAWNSEHHRNPTDFWDTKTSGFSCAQNSRR